MKSYLCYLLFVLAVLIPRTTTGLYAQQAFKVGIFKIGNNSYEITKSKNSPAYLIWNMDRSELKPNPLEVNGFASEYIKTKMTNHEELQKLVCEILGREKREKLAAVKEEISGWAYYRSDGTVINVMFKVHENTVLSLDDLVRIERTLQERFKATIESQPPKFYQHLYYIKLNYEWDFGK